jgi:hypothetical protein
MVGWGILVVGASRARLERTLVCPLVRVVVAVLCAYRAPAGALLETTAGWSTGREIAYASAPAPSRSSQRTAAMSRRERHQAPPRRRCLPVFLTSPVVLRCGRFGELDQVRSVTAEHNLRGRVVLAAIGLGGTGDGTERGDVG